MAFEPKFGADGLATCVTVDASRGDVLMVAHMNEAALRATLATGILHYWSRSRGALWRKGDTSGQTQTLVELRVDCDQDAFLAFVEVGGDGGACHTGRRSCFYRRVETDGDTARLAFIEPPSATADVGAVMEPPGRAELNDLTLILWRYLARKLKFRSGRRDAEAICRRVGRCSGRLIAESILTLRRAADGPGGRKWASCSARAPRAAGRISARCRNSTRWD